ncbi:Methyltransferase domain-containing protein [Sulfurivirga caldicuralii]|uniref:Methyltransferase domain-containing protein n=1 Tax=Sulfurivirga caldicuralii TaxID=364032 RepID=A0A1N6FGJ8_9GAMM|nr:methyltransferase domain-containing protein [Sulfurivirga caldicuralii]SIN94392.1 Methyltransferase domain-containing protein [Sulfurivirga caldicuralii]
MKPCWLDFRSEAAFAAGHVPGSAHFSWPALRLLQNALPAPHVGTLHLMEPPSDAVDWLRAKGYAVQLHDWSAWTGPVEMGSDSARLWQPTPALQQWLEEGTLPVGRALDLGCGGGRDAVWLAMQGWSVTAIDREARALARAEALARHEGVVVDFRACNLRQPDCMPTDPFDLVLMVRMHLPELFETMASRLASGGHVFVLCFHPDASKPAAAAHKATPEQLQRGFAALTPITAKIIQSSDGRPMSLYIGRKP